MGNTGKGGHRTRLLQVLALCVVFTLAACIRSTHLESAFSPLGDSECHLVSEDQETGASRTRCPGIRGFSVLVLYDDQRMSATLVDDKGQEHRLDYWNTVTGSFSSLGNRAEWRLSQGGTTSRPVAFIVEVKESTSNGEQSRWAVTKITDAETCVVARIVSEPGALQSARKLADTSSRLPCLPSL